MAGTKHKKGALAQIESKAIDCGVLKGILAAVDFQFFRGQPIQYGIRKPRMEMTKCPISIAVAFLVLPLQPLPRVSWVFLFFPGGWKQ